MLSDIPNKSGVYYLVNTQNKEVLYVGKAKSLHSRLRSHEVRRFLSSEGIDYAIHYQLAEIDSLDLLEFQLVRKLNPVLNTTYNELDDSNLHPLYLKYKPCTTKSKWLLHHRNTGLNLIELRKMYRKATNQVPITTEMGTYTGWEDYLKKSGWAKGTAYDYIYLAENWDIVIKLRLQDDDVQKITRKSIAVSRTLKIIRWFKTKVTDGFDPDTLTLDMYWAEVEGNSRAAGPSKKEMQAELMGLRALVDSQSKKIMQQDREIARLKEELILAEIALSPN